jgi:hypothetical protein
VDGENPEPQTPPPPRTVPETGLDDLTHPRARSGGIGGHRRRTASPIAPRRPSRSRKKHVAVEKARHAIASKRPGAGASGAVVESSVVGQRIQTLAAAMPAVRDRTRCIEGVYPSARARESRSRRGPKSRAGCKQRPLAEPLVCAHTQAQSRNPWAELHQRQTAAGHLLRGTWVDQGWIPRRASPAT